MNRDERRTFLLSPASTTGRRARYLFAPRSDFDVARRVRSPEGEAIGTVFAFLSGLYFRGKLSYARAFARPGSFIRIITSNRGLVSPDLRVTLRDLRAMSRGSIDPGHAPYRRSMTRSAEALAAEVADTDVVLLGSIATDKYSRILLQVFGERLLFPESFIGRGDMSRGGLLLRAVDENRELEYIPLAGAVRRGPRPPKLAPRPRTVSSKP